MGIKFSPGFTIIELMLFLAITGLLIAGVLVNAASSINVQRYRDGVEATKNTIGAQYAKVYSLTNDSTIAGVANVDPCQVLEGNNSATVRRGTSDCLYVGRLVQIEPDGTASTLRITPVIAKQNAGYNPDRIYDNQQTSGGAANASPYSLTQRYRIARYDGNSELIENRELDWGLTAVNSGNSTQLSVALLIIRSPIDGTVQTYNVLAAGSGAVDYTNLGSRMTNNNLVDAKFCMADVSDYPSPEDRAGKGRTGPLDPAQRTAILVHKSATGPGDIETRLNNPADTGGGAAC